MNRMRGFLCKLAFWELATSMLESVKNGTGLDMEEARNALARAPLHDGILDTYGRLLGELMARTKEEPMTDDADIDVLFLEEYFQTCLAQPAYPYVVTSHPKTIDEFPAYGFKGMAKYSEQDPSRQGLEFIRHFMRTALVFEALQAQKEFNVSVMPDGLNQVIGRFEHPEGHPVLHKLVARDPMLIDRLLEYFDYQLHEQVPEPTHLSASFGKFYRALVPVIAAGLWAPSTPVHCEQLWMAHAQLADSSLMKYADEAPWASGLAARLARQSNYPLHRSLHHLLHKMQLNAMHIAEFFPLPLVDCSAKEVLPLLVQLGSRSKGLEEGMHFGETFLLQLEEHHPRVASLLAMHLIVFPNAEEAHEHAGLLLEAFEDARMHASGRVYPEAIDNLDADMFE